MHTDVPALLFTSALLTAAKIMAPLLGAILLTGLLVSILQVATQIQEMTLTFVPKLLVTGLVLVLLGSWFMESLGTLMTTSLAATIRP